VAAPGVFRLRADYLNLDTVHVVFPAFEVSRVHAVVELPCAPVAGTRRSWDVGQYGVPECACPKFVSLLQQGDSEFIGWHVLFEHLRFEHFKDLGVLLPQVRCVPPLVRRGVDNGTAAAVRWLESLADAEIAEQIRAAKWQALNNLVLDCNRRISGASRDIARMCASLNAHLQALMDDVSAVVECLNGARTPNEVIASGVGDVWRELFPLRQSYDQIRQAQEWALLGRDELINSRSRYVDDAHASDVMIRNLDDVLPGWNQPDTTFRISGDAPRRQPWPADPIEMLVWLAHSDAEPWIPTIVQLAELHAERHRRLHPLPKNTRPAPGWTSLAEAEPDTV
jgi:hypothetical protein